VGDIRVEAFDKSFANDGDTHTLTNDVGATSKAFVLNLTARRTSGGDTGSTSNKNWDDFAAAVRLTGTSQLTFYRPSAGGGTIRMMGEVWRYVGSPGGSHEFIKRWSGEVNIASGNSYADQAISGVSNVDDVVCFVTGVEADLASRNDGNRVVSRARMTSASNLRVERGETGTAVMVHVEVVEFTGSAWSVGHFNLTSPSGGANNVTLNTKYDQSGGSFDVSDWANAFIWADMNCDTSGDHALEDTWFVVEPHASSTTQVSVTFDSGAGLTGAVVHGYAIKNSDLDVERETASKSIPSGLDTSLTDPSNVTTADERSIAESYVFTGGTGTAYARGAVTFKLNGSAVEAWVHRSGNNGTYRYAGIDLSGLTSAAAYSLVCDGGTYSLGGQAASLKKGFEIAAEAGSCVIAGQAATLKHNKKIDISAGSYLVTGEIINLAKGDPWLTGWDFRKKIDIQDTNIDSSLSDFPVYVEINNDADFHEARSDGYDIRFTQSDGETLLKYERIYWTGGNGSAATAHFRVKVPTILSSGGATIYIYYGKPDASDGEDQANVYDTNYKLFTHGHDLTSSTLEDALGTSTLTKKAANEPNEVNGKMYKAQDFDKVDDHVGCGSHSDIDNIWTNGGTISWWQYADSLGESNYGQVYYKGNGINEVYYNGSATFILRVFFSGVNGNWTFACSTGAWHHVAIAYDASDVNNDPDCYVDGSLVTETETSTPTGFYGSDASETLYLGGNGAGQWTWEGKLEAFRMSSTKRTAAWIKFERYNENESDHELTWYSEEVSGYTITIDAGSYAISGQVVSLLLGRKIVAASAAYSIAGQASGALKGSQVDAGSGSILITGQPTTLQKDSKIDIEAGGYSIAGQIANLLKGFKIGIEAGAVVITGQDAGTLYGRLISIDPGGYTLVGQDTDLLYSRLISIDPGSYLLTGKAAAILRDGRIVIDAGSYALSGQGAGLLLGRLISIDAGSFELTGQDIGFLLGYALIADPGSFALTGQIAGLLRGSKIAIDAGSYILAGQDVALIKTGGYTIDIESGAVILSGQPLNLLFGRKVAAGSGIYLITGQDVEALKGFKAIANPGDYSIIGQDISTFRGYIIKPDAGSLIVTGQDLDLLAARKIAAGSGTYNLQGQAINLLKARLISIGSGSYVLTGKDVELITTFLALESLFTCYLESDVGLLGKLEENLAFKSITELDQYIKSKIEEDQALKSLLEKDHEIKGEI
jgi:hypothetical protein